jgi:3-demethoxyubiquinol 3-hydroxylase
MPKPYFKDGNKKIEEILRVNHAGEFGAQRIYQGQVAHIKDVETKSLIKHMLDQELEHLDYFDSKLKEGLSRPTFLMPLWNLCGYALGAVSSALGNKTAMLVTENVEEVIVDHYQEQIDYLSKTGQNNSLLQKIKKFKQDEADHIHIAVDNDSRNAPLNKIFSKFVKNTCKIAIFLSKKI